MRRLKQRLVSQSQNYTKGLADMRNLCAFIETNARVYFREANRVVGRLRGFEARLEADCANFVSDAESLQTMGAVGIDEVVEVGRKNELIKQRIGEAGGHIDHIVGELRRRWEESKELVREIL